MPPVMFSVITKYHKGRHSLFLYNSEIFYAFTQDILRSHLLITKNIYLLNSAYFLRHYTFITNNSKYAATLCHISVTMCLLLYNTCATLISIYFNVIF